MRRHDPIVDLVLMRHAHVQRLGDQILVGHAHSYRLERFPITHVVVMRDHTGARLKITEEFGPQPQVYLGPQIEGDDGRLANVGRRSSSR